MRKVLVCLLALGMFAGVANAQTLNVFADTRDNPADILAPSATGGYLNEPNGGGRGDGQVRFISPKLATGVHVSNIGLPNEYDASTESLTVYADFAAAAGIVLSSVELNVGIPVGSGDYQLLGATVDIFNTDADVGATTTTGAPWDGTAESVAFSTSGGGAKFVQVPVLGAPAMYDSADGLGNGGPYRLMRVNLEADDRNCVVTSPPTFLSNSTMDVSLTNGVLLTTAVDNPPAVAGPVSLGYGYLAGAVSPASGDGLDDTATSAAGAFATIIVRMKFDFTDDGTVNNQDLLPFVIARAASLAGTADVAQQWLGDGDGDRIINNQDLNELIAVRAEGVTCP